MREELDSSERAAEIEERLQEIASGKCEFINSDELEKLLNAGDSTEESK